MTLLFVGGVMDVFWMAAIAMLLLVEKIVRGHLVSRVVGAGLIVGGWLLMLPMSSVGHVQASVSAQMPYDAGVQRPIPTPRPMMPRPQGMSAWNAEGIKTLANMK
jgi:hypothetical protein